MTIPIILPFTYVHRPTWDALDELARVYGHRWLVQPMFEDDDYAYHRFWARCWAHGGSFIVCEHDVIPTPGQIDQLNECPHGWCSFAEYEGGPPSLSLVRVRASLISQTKTIWSHRPSGLDPLPPMPWDQVDSFLTAALERQGFKPCVHTFPPVANTRPKGALH